LPFAALRVLQPLRARSDAMSRSPKNSHAAPQVVNPLRHTRVSGRGSAGAGSGSGFLSHLSLVRKIGTVVLRFPPAIAPNSARAGGRNAMKRSAYRDDLA
jgi:hypothetical protein